MQLTKSIVLPIVGMMVLILFNIISYTQDSIFFDKIMICSFILSVVFIGKMREVLSEQITDSTRRKEQVRTKRINRR